MRTLSADLQTAGAASERTPKARLTIRNLRMDFNPDEGSATEYDGNLPVSDNPVHPWATSLAGDSEMDTWNDIHQAIIRETGGDLFIYYRKVLTLSDWSGAWTQVSL